MEKQKFSDYGMFEGHPEYELLYKDVKIYIKEDMT